MIGVSYLLIAIIASVIWIGYRIIVHKKNKNISILREVVISFFFIYFLVVVFFTVCKGGVLAIEFRNRFYMNLVPFKETIKMFNNEFMGIRFALLNVIGNILMFIPLGFFIPLLFERCNKFSKVLFYSLLATITIELIQLLTSVNITDIDDVIFNTLGGIIGFLVYRTFYYIARKIKLKNLIDSIKDSDKLIFLVIKPLGIIFVAVLIISIVSLYKNTVSVKSSDKEMLQAFSYTAHGEAVCSKVEGDKKYILIKYDGYINLMEFTKALINRYTPGASVQMQGKDDYNFTSIYDGLGTELKKQYQVFGKNKKASFVEITYLGESYKERLKEDEYFIVITPKYRAKENGDDSYGLYEGKESKDLQIRFLDAEGNAYKDMKLEK